MIMWTDTVLVTMLLAYSVVEFIFREKLSLVKRTIALMVILVGILFFRFTGHNYDQLWIVPIAGFAYWAITYFEAKLNLEEEGRQFWNFIIRQGFQLVAIYMIALPFRKIVLPVGTNSIQEFAVQEWEIILLVAIANIWFAPLLIRTILNDLAFKTTYVKVQEGSSFQKRLDDEGAYHAGTLIGILERLLIIAAVMMSGGSGLNISFIGFILGTKSLARFKRFENQEFVEYFIVGTLTSVLFALLSTWPLQFVL